MIALLRGEVAVRRADHVVILCGSVGYRASVSAETLRHLPAVGEQATLHAHVIVRDDALALYGFHCEEERDLFLMLLSVQAVGPKVALAVLSGRQPVGADLARWRRATRRASRPCRASASGPPSGSSSSCARRWRRARGDVAREPIVARRGERDHPRALARDGLLELGYAPGEAEELLRDAAGDSAEELIAQALRLARSAS